MKSAPIFICRISAVRAYFIMQDYIKRDDLNDYLNIFAFIVNPPEDQLEKIKKLLELEINTRETLKYRDVFAKK